ncbi:glycerophosphodiester phosphodiesterase family protein [Qingshengfaniella alkalisoli]|uniref:VPLPA-CTERM sorting domain-containing protein n=1 Tax=Qingshengfaniella alkalisoli TaxID=2599296 RepID=A0A5B8IXE7_9RHOB|nr:glycerophosphodiester phosphodiesterase family protein [Qingshengfaniella alkalisoli]QDY70313.1 VPLPA-CTERM sorting domain-containing protein [Qingshengfaniella alkalisoli]
MLTLARLGGAAIVAALLPVMSAQAATIPGAKTLDGERAIVIAHRGAPAYLPENSIGGNELSVDMGAEYIETDVMMTKDGVLIAMHDSTLTRTTDVEDIYAPRNGGYRVSDFTYEEIQALTLTGNTDYPGYTPTDGDPWRVPTFADMLDALTDYNAANGTNVGILTEGKYGYSSATNQAVIDTLIEKGYDTPEKSAVQSFDFDNVAEYAELIGAAGVDMGVAQLGGAFFNGAEWTVSGVKTLTELAGYMDTVAVSYGSIQQSFIEAAHALGLKVFAWTFRPTDLEDAYADMANFLEWGLDGFITDNPDYVGTVLDDYYGATPVPLPAGLPLLGAGVVALGFMRRKRREA